MLTMEVSLPAEIEDELRKNFSPDQIRILLLVNPTIMLIIATVLGTVFYEKVGFSIPILERMLGKNEGEHSVIKLVTHGILGGILAGGLMILVAVLFQNLLPEEYAKLDAASTPTLLSRFLYGGITEEILIRFGFMTFVVLILSLILKKRTILVYITGILVAAILFGLGHFPTVFMALGEPSFGILVYVLLANAIGGVIFGWLYWKRGLESAFLAHMMAHVTMLSLLAL